MPKGLLHINGKRYELVVILVTAKDPYGRPSTATMVYDEQMVKLKGGEEFVTAFLPANVVAMKMGGHA